MWFVRHKKYQKGHLEGELGTSFLPETNTSTRKMDGWKTIFPLRFIFRDGMPHTVHGCLDIFTNPWMCMVSLAGKYTIQPWILHGRFKEIWSFTYQKGLIKSTWGWRWLRTTRNYPPPNPGCWLLTTRMMACLGSGIPKETFRNATGTG